MENSWDRVPHGILQPQYTSGLSKTGEFVQTSANAHVPVRDAEALFYCAKNVKCARRRLQEGSSP